MLTNVQVAHLKGIIIQKFKITFIRMVAMMRPTESWVAKWQGITAAQGLS